MEPPVVEVVDGPVVVEEVVVGSLEVAAPPVVVDVVLGVAEVVVE